MRILLGYGYYPGTTGVYLEQALSRQHQISFVGTAWASHRRLGFPPDMDLAAYIAALPDRPDLFVYVDSGLAPYLPAGLTQLPIPTVAYLIDAWPPGIRQRNTFRLRLAPLFDYLFVAHRGAVELFQSARSGLPAHWLPIGCDPEVHRDHHVERIYDIGFVGQYNRSYPERVAILDALSARYHMNDFRRAYYMDDMARIYSQSKIVVNISHSDKILNMRIFEVPPTGAMLLTQASTENGQTELLRDGEHFVTFTDLDDLLQKADYYLTHDDERDRIARQGQAHVLAHHTYAQRMTTMLNTVADDGFQMVAPARRWSPEQVQKTYMTTYSMMRLIDPILRSPCLSKGLRHCAGHHARQAYLVTLAMLRITKHEWLGL